MIQPPIRARDLECRAGYDKEQLKAVDCTYCIMENLVRREKGIHVIRRVRRSSQSERRSRLWRKDNPLGRPKFVILPWNWKNDSTQKRYNKESRGYPELNRSITQTAWQTIIREEALS